jgi:hypothetical protein
MKTLQIILLSLGLTVATHAGQSVFSADGKTIYLLPLSEGASIHKIDPATKKHQVVKPIEKPGAEVITAMTRNPQGEILLCTSSALWKWDGKEATAKQWIALPKQFDCLDLSCTRALPHHSGGHVLKLIEQLAEVKPHSKAIREFQRRSK